MAIITYPFTLTAGQPENVNQLNSNLTAITTQVNGNLDNTNFASADSAILGLSQSGAVRRGKSIIATSEARTNTAYGTHTTPDQVASIVLPTDGLIAVMFQATWQESVISTAKAAIFVGATQLKRAAGNAAAPNVQEADLGVATTDSVLVSGPMGLASYAPSAGAYSGNVTTGQAMGLAVDTSDAPSVWMGGPCYIFAAAGTYTISIQTKSSSGSVTLKNRKLWVWTVGF